MIVKKIMLGINGWDAFKHVKNKVKHLAEILTILFLLSSSLLITINVLGEGETITLDPVNAYYHRGDTVYVTGSISPAEPGKNVGIEVQDCDNTPFIFLSTQTNATGHFSTSFVIPELADLGICTIYASYASARDNTTFQLIPDIQASNPYPVNQSTEISRPPTNISIQANGTGLDVYFYFYNMTPVTDIWTQFASWTNVSTGRYNFTNFINHGNDFLWGNTTYYWRVNVTDGSTWVNNSYSYTTVELANGANARLDVDNDANVFVGDLNDVWANRNGQAIYDGIYDVDDDANVFVGDLNTIWAGRS